MRIIFPILAGLTAVASAGQVAAQTAPATPPLAAVDATTPVGQGGETTPLSPEARKANELIKRALAALETHPAIQARMRFRARVLNQSMLGSGLYQQGATLSHLYRLELKLQVAGQTASLLHVCDGTSLWIHQQLLSDPSIMKVDVASTLFALATRRQAAGHPPFPRTPGIGGLPRMLRELDEAYDFRCLGLTKLGNLPVWVVSGRWNDKYLAAALPDAAKAITSGDTTELPAQIPTHVLVCLGQTDYFPYRTEYRRDLEGAAQFADSLEDETNLMMRLELFEVRINGPLNPTIFTYNPGDSPVADFTEAYQKQLGVAPLE